MRFRNGKLRGPWSNNSDTQNSEVKSDNVSLTSSPFQASNPSINPTIESRQACQHKISKHVHSNRQCTYSQIFIGNGPRSVFFNKNGVIITNIHSNIGNGDAEWITMLKYEPKINQTAHCVIGYRHNERVCSTKWNKERSAPHCLSSTVAPFSQRNKIK